jgi:hypothetical protein
MILPPMHIAIIGTGNVGHALGSGWLKVGHEVVFGVRDPESPKARKARQALPDARFMEPAAAAAAAETVVITTPPEAVLPLIEAFGPLDGKVIIDTTNSVRSRPGDFPTAFHAFRRLCPQAQVVKCFNSTGFENMLQPLYPGGGIDMFCASDDAYAKSVAARLALDLGFGQCIDFGGDAQVELLEKFALAWINLAIMQGQGRNIALRVVRRP